MRGYNFQVLRLAPQSPVGLRVVSCGGELRRIFYYFCFFELPVPQILRADFWILGVFESWRKYFRGWILDIVNFCFRVPRSSSVFLINPRSSSIVSGSLIFEFYFLIPKSPEVLEFLNFGSPVSEPCNFSSVPVF